MAIDTKHKDLEGLRIDRSAAATDSGGSPWAKSIIIGGIVVIVLLGVVALAYRFLRQYAGSGSRSRHRRRRQHRGRCGA